MTPRPPPSGSGKAGLAFRLAWRQLWHEKSRLVAALSGVLFACTLIFMQIGFMSALFDSAVKLQTGLRAEVYLLNRTTEALWRSVSFPRARLMQALAVPGVERVAPMYVGSAQWRNPETHLKRTLLIMGVDPFSGLIGFEGLRPEEQALTTQRDTFLFDERAKPDFGPVPRMLQDGPVQGELAGRRVGIVGLFRLGPTFGTEGHALTSEVNFLRLFPGRSFSQVDVGAIFLKPGADPVQVRAQLAAMLPNDVIALTHAEMVAFEKLYWTKTAPIGFVFGMGVVIGMIVGCVIVYQILFSDISRHISEYATLKAMGYSNTYLSKVVMGESLILAVLGYIPGWILGLGLYKLASAQIFIPLTMTTEKTIMVFSMIFGMCVLSGMLALRKLRDANPADMF